MGDRILFSNNFWNQSSKISSFLSLTLFLLLPCFQTFLSVFNHLFPLDLIHVQFFRDLTQSDKNKDINIFVANMYFRLKQELKNSSFKAIFYYIGFSHLIILTKTTITAITTKMCINPPIV